MNTRFSPGLRLGLCFLFVAAGCSELSSDRYREIGALQYASTGMFDPTFDDLGQYRLHVRLAYAGGCCDPRGELQTEVQGRTIRLTPYFSDNVGCALDCLAVFTHDDTLAFGSPGPIEILVAGRSGDIEIDTTVVLN